MGRMKAASGDESDAVVAVDNGIADASGAAAIAVEYHVAELGRRAAVTAEHSVADPGLASLTRDGEISRTQGKASGGVEQSAVGGLVGETETQQVGLGSLSGTFLLWSYRGGGGGRRLQRGRFLRGRELQRVETALGVLFGRLRSLGQSPGGAGGPEAGVGNRRRDFSHRGRSSPQMP